MQPRALIGLALLTLVQCKPAPAPTPAARLPEDETRELIEQGKADEALARLESQPAGPGTWLLQGQAWAHKAESAPLPTPPPPVPGARANEVPPAPEFKPEELRAVQFLEQASSGNPRLGSAHSAIAALLAPHALRRQEAEAQKKGRRGSSAPGPTPIPGEPDWSVDRILREFQSAGQAEESNAAEIGAWIAFAEQVGRLAEADRGYQELVKRDHESAEPLVRHADFLTKLRKQPERAVELYQQALIWKPDDEAVKGKLADIYLDLGYENFKRREYMAAQVRFDEARKYARDPNSPQAQRLQGYEASLQEIRQGRSH